MRVYLRDGSADNFTCCHSSLKITHVQRPIHIKRHLFMTLLYTFIWTDIVLVLIVKLVQTDKRTHSQVRVSTSIRPARARAHTHTHTHKETRARRCEIRKPTQVNNDPQRQKNGLNCFRLNTQIHTHLRAHARTHKV